MADYNHTWRLCSSLDRMIVNRTVNVVDVQAYLLIDSLNVSIKRIHPIKG